MGPLETASLKQRVQCRRKQIKSLKDFAWKTHDIVKFRKYYLYNHQEL